MSAAVAIVLVLCGIIGVYESNADTTWLYCGKYDEEFCTSICKCKWCRDIRRPDDIGGDYCTTLTDNCEIPSKGPSADCNKMYPELERSSLQLIYGVMTILLLICAISVVACMTRDTVVESGV